MVIELVGVVGDVEVVELVDTVVDNHSQLVAGIVVDNIVVVAYKVDIAFEDAHFDLPLA